MAKFFELSNAAANDFAAFRGARRGNELSFFSLACG